MTYKKFTIKFTAIVISTLCSFVYTAQSYAAVPAGKATVTLNPSLGYFNVGNTITNTISFDTANIAISGIAVRLSYRYSGTTPQIAVSDITINPAITNSGDWTCPTKDSYQENSTVIIDIACANTSSTGYVKIGSTEFAVINLLVKNMPVINPTIMRFDPTYSIITQKSDGRDILFIPTSYGTYYVNSNLTPTIPPSPTLTLTPTLTPTPTLSPTPTIRPISYPSYPPIIKFKKPEILSNWLKNICRNYLKDDNRNGKSATSIYRNIICPSILPN
jgi:hypothetical protein